MWIKKCIYLKNVKNISRLVISKQKNNDTKSKYL